MLGKLKNGISVQLEDGRTITPEEVVGPPIPGRTIAVLQDGQRLLDLNRKCKLISNAFKYADEGAADRNCNEWLCTGILFCMHMIMHNYTCNC